MIYNLYYEWKSNKFQSQKRDAYKNTKKITIQACKNIS